MKVGIDFGTTNCTIGNLRRDGKRSVSMPVPSRGAWKNGKVVFGHEARDWLSSSDRDVFPIRDLKLQLGMNEVVEFGQTRVPVTELAAGLFRHLIEIQAPGGNVQSAVIATPVHVGLEHRQALRRAAEKAGITEVQLVYEPTAALIGAQRFELLERDGLFLVVDWGGGTLDIAVIRTDGIAYEELAVGGDVSVLGGSKIDSAIAAKLLDADADLRRAVNGVPGGLERFRNEIEYLKLEVLDSLEGREGSPAEHSPLWLDRIITLNPELVYAVLTEFAERATESILGKLRGSEIGVEEIHHVLFAGGVCQTPEARDRIMSEFPNARQVLQVAGSSVPLRPQELTGSGCTEITARKLHVELAENIGIRQADDSVCVLLEKGLPVSLNSYRRAEFIVTDPAAPEAIIDVGLIKTGVGEQDLMGWHGGKFYSLHQLFIPAGRYTTGQQQPVLEWLDVAIGVEDNLAVSLCVKAKMAMRERQHFITGIPLTLRFDQ